MLTLDSVQTHYLLGEYEWPEWSSSVTYSYGTCVKCNGSYWMYLACNFSIRPKPHTDVGSVWLKLGCNVAKYIDNVYQLPIKNDMMSTYERVYYVTSISKLYVWGFTGRVWSWIEVPI